jgi:hypothetical protein
LDVKISARFESLPVPAIVGIVCLVHVALLVWQAYVVQINNDGILYIDAARAYASGDWAKARALYPWFTYPALLGAATALSGLNPWTVALVMNGAASTLTVLLLLRCAWVVRPERATLLATAALLFGNLWFNDLRATIVRDHFFFLFMIGGFYCLIRDLQSPSLRYKAGFAVLTVIAALFRIEAFGFLMLVSVARAISEAPSGRLRIALIAALVVGSVCAVLATAFWTRGGIETWMAEPLRRVEIIRNEVLGPYEARKASVAYVGMIVGLLVYGLVNSIGLATVLLASFFIVSDKENRRSAALHAGLIYLAAGAAIYGGQIYMNLVFDQRHGLVLSLVLTPIAAIGLVQLTVAAKQSRSVPLKALLTSAVILLLVGFFVGLRKTDAHSYRMTAGEWLAQNVPAGAHIASNSGQILFYGGFRNTTPGLVEGLGTTKPKPAVFDGWKTYDVVVLEFSQDQLDLVRYLEARFGDRPERMFENRRGDQILIYRPKK